MKMKVTSGINWDKTVEHPFLIVKRQLGYAKNAYRDIAKNMNRFQLLFARANMLMCIRAGRKQDFIACMGELCPFWESYPQGGATQAWK